MPLLFLQPPVVHEPIRPRASLIGGMASLAVRPSRLVSPHAGGVLASGTVMLLLGNDASDGFRFALDALRDDVDAWEKVSRSTDFDA